MRATELIDSEHPRHFETDGHALTTGAVMMALSCVRLEGWRAEPVFDEDGNYTRRILVDHPLVPDKRFVVTIEPLEETE